MLPGVTEGLLRPGTEAWERERDWGAERGKRRRRPRGSGAQEHRDRGRKGTAREPGGKSREGKAAREPGQGGRPRGGAGSGHQ